MIIDSLKGFERYLSLHPKFPKVYEFLAKSDLHSMEPGRYPIEGKEVYYTVWEGEGKGDDIPPLEVHDSYIDIHLLIEGSEVIGHTNRSRCSGENISYDNERDIAYLEDIPENFVNLSPENIAIIFPHDAHAPLIGKGKIKKMVIKVSINAVQ